MRVLKQLNPNYKHRQVERKQLKQMNYIKRGSEEEKTQLMFYKDSLARCYNDMISFHNDGRLWLTMTEKDRERRSDEWNKMVTSRMILSLGTPLRRGVNLGSLSEVAGMYVTFALFNKDFRNEVNQIKGNLLNGYLSKKGNDVTLMSNPFYASLCKKRDTYLAKANNGRVPFTPETAALQDIRFSMEVNQRIYNGEDKDVVMNDFNNARNTLYRMMESDGVSREDMRRSQNVMLDMMIENQPVLKYMFKEVAYEEVVKTEEKEVDTVSYDANGNSFVETVKRWDGTCAYKDGSSCDEIHPRMPLDAYGVEDVVFSYGCEQSKAYMEQMGSMDYNVMTDEVLLTRLYELDTMSFMDGVDFDEHKKAKGCGLMKSTVFASTEYAYDTYGDGGMVMSRIAKSTAESLFSTKMSKNDEMRYIKKMNECFSSVLNTYQIDLNGRSIDDACKDCEGLIRTYTQAMRMGISSGESKDICLQSIAKMSENAYNNYENKNDTLILVGNNVSSYVSDYVNAMKQESACTRAETFAFSMEQEKECDSYEFS